MGLGKTLTVIALILTQRSREQDTEKDKNVALTRLPKDGIQVPPGPAVSPVVWASGEQEFLSYKAQLRPYLINLWEM